jgi:hypothetical protein
MDILFFNHKIKICGVYQYGLRLYQILHKSTSYNYIYVEIENYDEYINYINIFNPKVIIYNYHLLTMPWLNNLTICKYVPSIGIPHETVNSLFDIILSIDPDEKETDTKFTIPRPIYDNISEIISSYKIMDNEIMSFIEYNEGSDVPIFGSFGFGFKNKGFDKIVSIINSEYKEAIIKLVITKAFYDPDNISNINYITNNLSSINLKPGIKVMITHKFFTTEEILLFLNTNNCNIFMYDKMEGRGISSVIDYAISVNKPFVISDSYMFRNVYLDDICVYKTNIKTAIENSKKIVYNLKQKYSNINLINKINKIVDNVTKNDQLYMINRDNSFYIFGIRITSYYYTENFIETTNVSKHLKNLFNDFITINKTNFKASNDAFFDTHNGSIKTLFINIHKQNTIDTISYSENELVNWIDIIKFVHREFKNIGDLRNLIEVSIGEIIDKYSILELKKKYISDQNKINEIQKEIDILNDKVPKDSHFYKQLIYINELIWLDTDKIKIIKYDNTNEKMFANISNEIFENNQKRFRLKNYFNFFQNSNIKEQKSYNDNVCYIEINDEEEIYQKIPEINYLCISYDIIYINCNFKDIFNKLFKNPNIFFKDDLLNITNYHKEILNTFTLEIKNKHHFEFEPITYLSGGRFGDFINQLSVICEKYYETGRKGILYIYDIPGDNFIFTLEKTYKDTYNIIKNLRFIKDYKIYNNEHYDIQLSQWRHHLVIDNWFNVFNKYYNVTWGKHKWLIGNYDDKWTKLIIFNITPYRFTSLNVINMLKSIITKNIDKCIFVSNEKEHYEYFSKQINVDIIYYKPADFDEMVTIVNSCEMAYLGFSSLATIANALHKNHVLIGRDNADFTLNNLKGVMPHVIDILI